MEGSATPAAAGAAAAAAAAAASAPEVAPSAAQHDDATATTSAPAPQPASGGPEAPEAECPFCKYMRSGGCAAEFDAFMECGERAEQGEVEYSDCMKQFEGMKLCMEANRQNYLEVLDRVEDPQAPQPEQQQQQQQPEAPAGQQQEGEAATPPTGGAQPPS